MAFKSDTGQDLVLTAPSTKTVTIQSGGLDAIYIDANQNVAIGHTSPLSPIHVSGNTRIDGNVDINGTLEVNSMASNLSFQDIYKITNLIDPTNSADAATKSYVDSVASGLDVKASVRAMQDSTLSATSSGTGVGKTLTATSNGALSVDGVTMAVNDRVLYAVSPGISDNGIYEVTQTGDASNPYILTRATDSDEDAEVSAGLFTFISEGTTYADTGWVVITNDAITVDTTAIEFSQFTGGNTITAGTGLVKVGNTIDANLGAGIAELPSDEIGIELKSDGGLDLVDPGTGSPSTATDAVVAIKLNGTSLATSASGLEFNTTWGDARYANLTGDTFTGAVNVDTSQQFVNTDTNAETHLFLQQTGGTQGDGNYSSSIAFSKINSGRRMAAIVGKQTAADADQGGLAFFVHPSSSSTHALTEAMVLDHSGNLTITGSIDSPSFTSSSFSSTQVLYANGSGVISGDSGFTYDATNDNVHIAGKLAVGTTSFDQAFTVSTDGNDGNYQFLMIDNNASLDEKNWYWQAQGSLLALGIEKDDGSGNNAIMTFSRSANGFDYLDVDSKFRVHSSGALSTGNELSPDVDAGGICINHGANDGNAITIKSSDVIHAMTNLADADSYLRIRKVSPTIGGAQFQGFGETTYGINILGSATTTTTSGVGNGPVLISGNKDDGLNSVTNMADDEVTISFRNNGNTKMVMKGNGDVITQGSFESVNLTDGHILYSNGNVIAGDSAFTFNDTTKAVTLNGDLLFEDGDHAAITYNDGGGNFNIRAGHTFNTGNHRYSDTGFGAVHLEFAHEVASPQFLIRVSEDSANAVAGAAAVWNSTYTFTNDDKILIDGNEVFHQGNDGTGSGLDADTVDGLEASQFVRSDQSDTMNGTLTLAGSLVTGNELAPDVDTGGICVQTNGGDGLALTFKNTDVAHPFTSIAEADTYTTFRKSSLTDGGVRIQSFSGLDNASFKIEAYRETPATADTSGGVISLDSYKSDGGVTTALVADGENMVVVRNNATTKVSIKGNGDIISQGGIVTVGKAGIDRSSIGVGYTSVDNLVVGDGVGTKGIVIESGVTGSGIITFGDGSIAGRITYNHSDDSLCFITSATEQLRISSTGQLSTGNELSPDCGPGGITLQQNADDGPILTIKSTDVAHPFTGFAEADTYGMFDKVDSTNGGLHIRGNSSGSVSSLLLMGSRETPSTLDNAVGVVDITGRKSDGVTSFTSLTDTENLLSISNDSTVTLVIKGNGDLVTQGSFKSQVTDTYVLYSNAGEIAGDSGFTYDATNDNVHIAGKLAVGTTSFDQAFTVSTDGNDGNYQFLMIDNNASLDEKNWYWQAQGSLLALGIEKDDGSGNNAIMTFSRSANGFDYLDVDSKFRVHSSGALSTGNELSPDVGSGGLCLQQNADDNAILTVKSTDVAHPFTSIAEADTYGSLCKFNNTDGGLHVIGYSSGTTAGMRLEGYRETLTTVDTGNGVFSIDANKSDGVTGATAVADDENMVAFRNQLSTKVVIKGNGDVVSQGDFESVNLTDGHILYSNGNVIAGDSAFTFNDTTKAVTLNGDLLFEDGDHAAITYNDGGGNFNIRAGHTYNTGNHRYSDTGFGAVHLEFAHEATSPQFLIRVSEDSANAVAGASAVWNSTYTFTNDDKILIDGNEVFHQGNDGTGSGLDADTVDGLEASQFVRSDQSDTMNGTLTLAGSLVTGNELAPDVDTGGICVQTNGGDGNALTFKNTDVAHPFTGFAEADTYGMFDKVDNLNGGLHIRGNSSNTVSALSLLGSRQTPSTSDTGFGVVDITGRKSDGGTGTAVLADGENLLSVANLSSVKLSIKGNGDLITQGSFKSVNLTDGHILYSNGNVIAGDSAFTFNDTTKAVTLNGDLLFEDGDHAAITYNDGGGNFNIRAGHTYNTGDHRYSDTGFGAVHLEFAHEATSPQFLIRVSEDSASAVAGSAVNWTGNFIFRNDGDLEVGGGISTGGENAPDVDSGGICINHGSGTGNAQSFKNTGCAHPFTGLEETDTYGTIKQANSSQGGLAISGFNDNADSGIAIRGYRKTPSSSNAANGIITFNAYKSDGATSTDAPASGETAYSFKLGTAQGVVIKGNGDIITLGNVEGATLSYNGEDTDDRYVSKSSEFAISTTAVNVTAANRDSITITDSGTSRTVTLPASPSAGNMVRVHNATSRTDHVIGRNGQNIMGLAEDLVIDVADFAVTLEYIDSTRGWRVV